MITGKLFTLFHEFKEAMEASPVHRDFRFPEGTDYQTGKILRGENYKGLPYVILDFPRLFQSENIFAFRTIFWWGNYFSFTLHLKGKPLMRYRDVLIKNLPLRGTGILLYTGADEWEHDVSVPEYVSLSNQSSEVLRRMEFIKLSKKLELKSYPLLLEKGREAYEGFLKLLS